MKSYPKTSVSSTVPLRESIVHGRINLRVKTLDLEINHEDDACSVVSINIPMKDIGIDRIVGNLLDELEMKGVARGAAERAADKMVEVLQDELLIQALRNLIVQENDIKL